jgi:hypothetical protein
MKKQWMTDQCWAFLFVVTGCVMAIICKHYGLTDAIGAGIVGGGLTALTKAEAKQQNVNVDHVDTLTQGEITKP